MVVGVTCFDLCIAGRSVEEGVDTGRREGDALLYYAARFDTI